MKPEAERGRDLCAGGTQKALSSRMQFYLSWCHCGTSSGVCLHLGYPQGLSDLSVCLLLTATPRLLVGCRPWWVHLGGVCLGLDVQVSSPKWSTNLLSPNRVRMGNSHQGPPVDEGTGSR